LHFLDGRRVLAHHREHSQLVLRLFLADLAHGESNVHKHPIANARRVITQQTRVNVPPHTDYFH
jgi:hypothetical protein